MGTAGVLGRVPGIREMGWGRVGAREYGLDAVGEAGDLLDLQRGQTALPGHVGLLPLLGRPQELLGPWRGFRASSRTSSVDGE